MGWPPRPVNRRRRGGRTDASARARSECSRKARPTAALHSGLRATETPPKPPKRSGTSTHPHPPQHTTKRAVSEGTHTNGYARHPLRGATHTPSHATVNTNTPARGGHRPGCSTGPFARKPTTPLDSRTPLLRSVVGERDRPQRPERPGRSRLNGQRRARRLRSAFTTSWTPANGNNASETSTARSRTPAPMFAPSLGSSSSVAT